MGEFNFLVQGSTAYNKSTINTQSLGWSALWRGLAVWAEPGLGCRHKFHLNSLERTSICLLPSSIIPDWGQTWLLGLVLLWCHLSVVISVQSSGTLKLESLSLNDPGIQTGKQAASPALHQIPSARGREVGSSSPGSTEDLERQLCELLPHPFT